MMRVDAGMVPRSESEVPVGDRMTDAELREMYARLEGTAPAPGANPWRDILSELFERRRDARRWWISSGASIEMRESDVLRRRQEAAEVLRECEAYFAQRNDADLDGEQMVAN